MGIEPTAGGCPATGFEVQERHQAANYSHEYNNIPALSSFEAFQGNWIHLYRLHYL